MTSAPADAGPLQSTPPELVIELRSNSLHDASMQTPPQLGPSETVRALGEWSTGGGSLARSLAAAFRSAIDAGLLNAGSRLPPERTLAPALAVSRSTLVQALDELRADDLVRSRRGSGTTIAGSSHPPITGAEPRVLAQLVGVDHGIDLAAATPADALALGPVTLDLDQLRAAGPTHGYGPRGLLTLRTLIAARHVRQGLPTATDQIQITNGAQHALHLVMSALVPRGAEVVVEQPSYPGVLDVLTNLGAQPAPVERGPDGLDVDALVRTLRRDPALVYLMPQVHAPTGLAGGDAEIERLAAYLDDWGGTVVEDAVLADLRHDGPRQPGLAERCRAATVVRVESLSKSVWGGLRIGWIRGPGNLLDRIATHRHAADLGTSIPSQLLATAALDRLDERLVDRRIELGQRVATATSLLRAALPDWEPVMPDGGLALWVRLPLDDSLPFVQRAQRHGVFIAPGGAARIGDDPSPHIRLTIDRPPALLELGIARLVDAWAAHS